MTHQISTFEIVHPNLERNQITWHQTKPSRRTAAQLRKLRQVAMILAHRILQEDPEITQSQANKNAWTLAKHFEGKTQIIDGVKVDGKTKIKRVVLDDWTQRNEIKGTGRPLKPGRKLFTDLAKLESGKHATLSVVLDNVKIY